MHTGLANADKPIAELTDEATKAVFKQYRYRLEGQIGPGTLTSDNRRLRVRLDMRDENSATSVTGIKGTGLMLGLIEDTTKDFIHIHVHESEIHNFEAAFAESRSTPYKDDSQLIWEAYEGEWAEGVWTVTDRGVNASGRVGDLLQHLDQLGIEPQEVNVSTLSQLAADIFRKEYITIKGVPYLRSSPEEQKKTDKEIAERIENADLSEPIIVVTDDGEPFAVADGNHRLQKAVINNEPAVLVRYVTKEQLPG